MLPSCKSYWPWLIRTLMLVIMRFAKHVENRECTLTCKSQQYSNNGIQCTVNQECNTTLKRKNKRQVGITCVPRFSVQKSEVTWRLIVNSVAIRLFLSVKCFDHNHYFSKCKVYSVMKLMLTSRILYSIFQYFNAKLNLNV